MDGSQKISINKDELYEYTITRSRTLKLVKNLTPEDMVIQTNEFVSPTKWHLGHTSWFFEKFILSPYLKGYKIFHENFNFVFNSYYNSVGCFNQRDKRGFLNRPSFEEVLNYRNYIDENINLLFKNNVNNSLKFLLALGVNHEQQHQELILMDIKNVFYQNPLKPTYINSKIKNNEKYFRNEFILNNSEKFKYGHSSESFCYDNETPSNFSTLEPFNIKPFVTNLEWKEFIEDGGYKSHEFWLSDGWNFINKNNINKPMYWFDKNYYFTLNGEKKIDDNSPVSHISFYEACAFARYKNLRLPNEFEIELFLKKQSVKGNFLEEENFCETDYNNFNLKNVLYGNLWLWTSSNYVPYKNYKCFENELMEYNSKFMCNQFVLKGGSFATSKHHIRSSYRNFYYPHDRWQFSGLRLVEDL